MYPGIEERVAACLPKSGGTMTGGISLASDNYSDNSHDVHIGAGTTYRNAGTVVLRALNSGSNPGGVEFNACSESKINNVKIYADGSFTNNGKAVETVDSSGSGWIRYTNGLQICWGSTGVLTANTDTQINFPKNFAVDSNGNGRYSVSAMRNASANVATNSATIKALKAGYFNIRDAEGGNYRYIAIGPWK